MSEMRRGTLQPRLPFKLQPSNGWQQPHRRTTLNDQAAISSTIPANTRNPRLIMAHSKPPQPQKLISVTQPSRPHADEDRQQHAPRQRQDLAVSTKPSLPHKTPTKVSHVGQQACSTATLTASADKPRTYAHTSPTAAPDSLSAGNPEDTDESICGDLFQQPSVHESHAALASSCSTSLTPHTPELPCATTPNPTRPTGTSQQNIADCLVSRKENTTLTVQITCTADDLQQERTTLSPPARAKHASSDPA